MAKSNPLKHFNDQRSKSVNRAQKGMDSFNKKMKEGGNTPSASDYSKKVAAGKAAGWKEDQPGAFKKGLTDTASVTYLKSPAGEYAGVKKPKKK